jgi:hypothetical protein
MEITRSTAQQSAQQAADAASQSPGLAETLSHPAFLAIAGLAFLMLSVLLIMGWIWLRNAKYDKVEMRLDL